MATFTEGRYATIAATTALVVALGGSSYAAAVVTGADIKDGTVTGKDVKNKTLQLKDLSGGARRGLKGATGPAGPRGVPGPAGSSMLYLERILSVSTPGGVFVPATCPEGSTPVTLSIPPDPPMVGTAPVPPQPPQPQAGINFQSNYMYLDLAKNAIMVELYAYGDPTPLTRKVDLVCFVG